MAKRGGFPGGGMPGNMANLMKQAQKMQKQMEEQAKEMEEKSFTATAGGGAVEVTVSGKKEVQKWMLFPLLYLREVLMREEERCVRSSKKRFRDSFLKFRSRQLSEARSLPVRQ